MSLSMKQVNSMRIHPPRIASARQAEEEVRRVEVCEHRLERDQIESLQLSRKLAAAVSSTPSGLYIAFLKGTW